MTTAALVVATVAVLITAVGVMTKMLVTLDSIQEAAKVVAADLAQAHARADAVEGHPGEAGDAAARSE